MDNKNVVFVEKVTWIGGVVEDCRVGMLESEPVNRRVHETMYSAKELEPHK